MKSVTESGVIETQAYNFHVLLGKETFMTQITKRITDNLFANDVEDIREVGHIIGKLAMFICHSFLM